MGGATGRAIGRGNVHEKGRLTGVVKKRGIKKKSGGLLFRITSDRRVCGKAQIGG